MVIIRITQEEFDKRIKGLVGGEYVFLEPYTRGVDKIWVKHCNDSCNNYEYKVTPSAFFAGTRCPKCNGGVRKTNEDFVKEVEQLTQGEYEFLDRYNNSAEKIRVKHKSSKCGGYVYEVVPQSFLSGSRCPKCEFKYKVTSDETFVEKVRELVGEEYTFIDDYVTTHTPIRVRHNNEMCKNHEYKVRPSNFMQGTRCPKCNGGVSKSKEDFERRVKELVGEEYTLLGEYVRDRDKIRVRHNNNGCGNHEYLVAPQKILSGRRCPKCYGNKVKTDDDFRNEVKGLVGDEYDFLDTYVNNRVGLRVKHNNDSCNHHVYKVIPKEFLHKGVRCPKCNRSKGEVRTSQELESLGVKYKEQYQLVKNPKTGGRLRSDFGVLNTEGDLVGVIEYDGIGHYEPIDFYGGLEALEGVKYRDNVKNDYCKENHIPLLRIPYWKYDKVGELVGGFIEELNI